MTEGAKDASEHGNVQSATPILTNGTLKDKMGPSLQGPILSFKPPFKAPFFKIGVADWTLPGYNHFW